MDLNDKELNDLKRVAKSSGDKIRKCGSFVAMFTVDFEKDPVAAIQLSIAIMLDKPIGILAMGRDDVPEKLEAVADAVVYCDGSDLETATRELMQKMRIMV